MGEPSLSGRTEALRDAFAALARSLKRISIYRHAREQRAGYLEPALAAMRGVLEREGSFTVEVQTTALVVGGEQVYTEAPREWGFCFRLHRDGVRTLTFRRGLGLEELLVLCEVALFDPQGGAGAGREDAVTELWKADLSSITWTAVPGYRMERNEAEAPRVAEAVARAAARAREALQRVKGGSTFADDAQGDGPLFTDLQRGAADPQRWTDLAQRAALTLARIVEQGYAGRDLEAMQEATVRLFDEMIERGEPLALSRSIEGIRRMGGPQAGDFRIALGRHLMDPLRLTALARLAARDERALAQALPPYLMLLPREACAVLIEVLNAAEGPVRQPVARAIVDRAESDRERFAQALRTGSVETALSLLGALGSSPLATRASLAAAALAHATPRVRLEAATQVAQDPAAAVQHLGPLLGAQDAAVRVVAANALGRTGVAAESSAALLIAAIERPGFADAPREEQGVFYRALGKLESLRGFDFLCDQLAVRRGLFRKRAAEATRLLAVQGLAEERSARSLRILDEAAAPQGCQPPAVAAAARTAAARLRAAAPRSRS